jgi:hypothetical protein
MFLKNMVKCAKQVKNETAMNILYQDSDYFRRFYLPIKKTMVSGNHVETQCIASLRMVAGISSFGVASRYAGAKSRLPACTYTMLRSGSFAFISDVARRYAERGLDAKSRRDDTLLTVGEAKRNLRITYSLRQSRGDDIFRCCLLRCRTCGTYCLVTEYYRS